MKTVEVLKVSLSEDEKTKITNASSMLTNLAQGLKHSNGSGRYDPIIKELLCSAITLTAFAAGEVDPDELQEKWKSAGNAPKPAVANVPEGTPNT